MSLDINTLHDTYIVEYYKSLDCARALTCYMLFVNDEHTQLANLEFDPLLYNSGKDAHDSLSATKFLSKATFLSTNVDKKQVALDKFFEAEEICKDTNRRIVGHRFKNPLTESVLLAMTFKISNILGSFDAEEFVDSCNWGPGSTTLLRKAQATHPKKFSVERKITAEAYDFVAPWFQAAYPLWDMMFEIDGASKVVTVPKNAKTDRVIAIEPGVNLWFQKGCGSLIRKRLRAFGLDLNTQEINQKRARLGSKSGRIATVDFKAASDTISYELVREVLPTRWFTILNAFRSKSSSVGSDTIQLAKFSSMGNGYTFELESLLFYALALATCECLGIDTSGVSVFGDDVTIPSDAYDLFVRVSDDVGFTVNVEKSFDFSPYRESCGSHFWHGFEINPIFYKESFNGQASIIVAANRLRIHARGHINYGCDRRFRRCWQILVDYLGHSCPRLPIGYESLGIIVNFDELPSVPVRAKHGYEGYMVPVHAVQSMKLDFHGKGLLLQKLKAMGTPRIGSVNYMTAQLEESSGGNQVPLPGRIKYSRKRVLVPQWIDIGPWV